MSAQQPVSLRRSLSRQLVSLALLSYYVSCVPEGKNSIIRAGISVIQLVNIFRVQELTTRCALSRIYSGVSYSRYFVT